MDAIEIDRLRIGGESLHVEFKSDRGNLSDREIYETVVCLANSDGGVLLIGIEDNGNVTGARPRHGAAADPIRRQAAIFNNTVPSINTRVAVAEISGSTVIAVEVHRYPEICATREGKSFGESWAFRGRSACRSTRTNTQAGESISV